MGVYWGFFCACVISTKISCAGQYYIWLLSKKTFAVLFCHRIFEQLAKALIRLRACTGWSEALLVTCTTLLEIACHGLMLFKCLRQFLILILLIGLVLSRYLHQYHVIIWYNILHWGLAQQIPAYTCVRWHQGLQCKLTKGRAINKCSDKTIHFLPRVKKTKQQCLLHGIR